MSSTSFRPPLGGVIYQGEAIVGGVDLSGNGQAFIDQFNREYARLGLRVEVPPADQVAAGGEPSSRSIRAVTTE